MWGRMRQVLAVAAVAAVVATGCGDGDGSTNSSTSAEVQSSDWAVQLDEAEQGLVDAMLDVADAALAGLDAPAGEDVSAGLSQACEEAAASVEPLRAAAAAAPDEELSQLVDEAADRYDAALASCSASGDFDAVEFNQKLLEASTALETYRARLDEVVSQGG